MELIKIITLVILLLVGKICFSQDKMPNENISFQDSLLESMVEKIRNINSFSFTLESLILSSQDIDSVFIISKNNRVKKLDGISKKIEVVDTLNFHIVQRTYSFQDFLKFGENSAVIIINKKGDNFEWVVIRKNRPKTKYSNFYHFNNSLKQTFNARFISPLGFVVITGKNHITIKNGKLGSIYFKKLPFGFYMARKTKDSSVTKYLIRKKILRKKAIQ